MARTITSANSVLSLSAPDINPVPVNIQGYAADEAFDNEQVDAAETVMGVDGRMSAGFTPFITKMPITLQADSPSVEFFDQILGAMEASTEVVFLQGSLILPSVGKGYNLVNGVLTRAKQFAGAKKILQPQSYEINWESVQPAPLV